MTTDVISDPREAQNDWNTDPLNPAAVQRRIEETLTKVEAPPPATIPADIVELIQFGHNRLKAWFLSMGVSQAEYERAMMALAQKAVDRVASGKN